MLLVCLSELVRIAMCALSIVSVSLCVCVQACEYREKEKTGFLVLRE